MSFIEKKDPVVLNIKLTSKGRELLSKGELTFNYYALGDSEIDYNFMNAAKANDPDYSLFNTTILRPLDTNPKILSFIPRNLSGDSYNEMTSIPTTSYIVENPVSPIGFFNADGSEFLTDINHVKQPDAMIDVSLISGGTKLALLKSPTFGASSEEPLVGDLLLVKWTYGTSTTGHTVLVDYPTPHLFYKITGIVSGTFGGDNLVITVDRDLPDFTEFSLDTTYAGAMVYYDYINFTGDTIATQSSTEYLEESVLTFLENSQCSTATYPFWNMSILYTEEIAGVSSNNIKYTQFNSNTLAGFVSYIQNQAPVYKKLGVIHYTNSSPANVYAEGFRLSTPTLEIPTIMWHGSSDAELGVTLTPIGAQKMLTGETKSLNTQYYDLADLSGNIVGKVFNDLKLFVIEDQELLFAMSYKSNRSWTLPNYTIGS